MESLNQEATPVSGMLLTDILRVPPRALSTFGHHHFVRCRPGRQLSHLRAPCPIRLYRPYGTWPPFHFATMGQTPSANRAPAPAPTPKTAEAISSAQASAIKIREEIDMLEKKMVRGRVYGSVGSFFEKSRLVAPFAGPREQTRGAVRPGRTRAKGQRGRGG